MSDLHDDLLNYELGDGEELDDQTLLVGDEDDLLLSDEELEKDKFALKEEAEEWVASKLIPVKEFKKEEEKKVVEEKQQKAISSADIVVVNKKQPVEVTTTTSAVVYEKDKKICAAPSETKIATGTVTATATATIPKNNSESDVSTSGDSPIKQQKPPPQLKKIKQKEKQQLTRKLKRPVKNLKLTKIDEVTSTNKDVEVDTVSSMSSRINYENSVKDDIHVSSQESYNFEQCLEGEQDLLEDSEEQQHRGERRNIKHANERDDNTDSSPEKPVHGGRFAHSPKRGGRGGGGGGIRGHFPTHRPLLTVRYPHLNYSQYSHHPNENVNPQQAPVNQFPAPRPYHPNEHQNVTNSMPARQPFHPPNNLGNGPRMEFRPNFRPQNPNEYNNGGGGVMFNPRGPRPDFHAQNHPNGQQLYNNFAHPQNNMRPMFRPDMHNMRPRMPLRPPQPLGGMQPMPNNLAGYPNGPRPSIGQPQHSQHHLHPTSGHQQHGVNLSNPPLHTNISTGNSSLSAPVISRKVLINPNFKGGVEAATNQLMKDTQFMQTINSHVPHLQSDEELLRQQEEFINKNRIHIQKRYARSPPERNRERSYSPPQRRERYFENHDNNRRGFGLRGRGRRAGSRDGDNKFAKRRRSTSPGRKRDKERNEEPEDEETRIYRLEIEKQKEMREKILRDKEMRRRRAAEGKTSTDEPANTSEEHPPAKLKPIIVTESKIISLRKSKEYEKNVNAAQPTSTGNNSKSTHSEAHHSSSGHFKNTNTKRVLPTAKILPAAKRNISEHLRKETGGSSSGLNATAVVKPVIKNRYLQTNRNLNDSLDDEEDEEDDELLNEERLLADTPSPLDSMDDDDQTDNDSDNRGDSEDDGEPERKRSANSFMSSNRKVVLKSTSTTKAAISSSSTAMSKTISNTSVASAANSSTIRTGNDLDTRKRIFDRLERKKIGINETAKRRIQRIFIKNVE